MPIHVFAGDDSFSVGNAVSSLTRSGNFERVDVERIDAGSVPARSILMTIGTAGLFAERRMVILEGLGRERKERARGRSKSSGDEDSLTLDDLLPVTPESTTVVVLLTGIRSDSRLMKDANRLSKEKKIALRMFPAPKAKEMPQWLQQRARAGGVRLDARAAQQLASRVGDQVALAGMELRKLATAAGPDGAITSELVEALVAQTSEESIFPLVDAIAGRQPQRAFQLLAKQLDQFHGNGAELSLPLIRLLARQMRLLLLIKLLGQSGAAHDEIVSALKLPEYYAGRYFSQAAKLTQAELSAALENLAATEQGLKNGEAGPAALQLLIADLTQIRASA